MDRPQLRAVIVDDEQRGRELLQEMLTAHPEFSVLDTCSDVRHAIDAVRRIRPDVVFLNIEMPEGSGFDVVHALRECHEGNAMPHVVFMTACDAHAVRAFEAGALDYLLKPFGDERLSQTLRRVLLCEMRCGSEAHARGPAREQSRPLRRLPVKVGDRIQLVPTAAVGWFEADGKYIRAHRLDAQGRAVNFSLRCTFSSLERQLDPDQFLRVNRSAIVNIDHMLHAEPWSHGEYVLVMRDGSRLVTTPGFRHGIQGVLRGI